MTSTRIKTLAPVLYVLIIVATILSGCGASATTPTTAGAATPTKASTASTTSPSTASTQAPTGAATAATAGKTTPTAAAKTGGRLVSTQLGDGTQKHFDVHLMTGKATGMWWGNIYESLLGHDPDTFEIVPRLAEKWEFSPDGKSLTLFVRKGVKWQNIEPVNGREFTADDVKWNIERIRDSKTPGYWTTAMQQVVAVDVADKHTVKLSFKEPYAPMLYNLAEPTLYMYPRELYEKYGDKQTVAAIGTGPFMLKAYEPEIALRMVKNPDYWDKGLPRLDAIDIVVIKDLSARLAALRSGQVSYLDSVAEADMTAVMKSNPQLNKQSHPTNALELRLNAASKTNKALADVRVRKAISLALDRTALVQLAAQGNGIPISNYPPTFAPAGAYREQEELKLLPGYRTPKNADIAEARRLLAEAGYANGLTIQALTITGLDYVEQTNVVIQSQLKAIGIDWKIVLADYTSVNNAVLQTGEFEAAVYYTTTGDGDAVLYNKYYTKAKSNVFGWGNTEIDKLLDAGRAEGDTAARTKIYREIEDKLLEQNWIIGLYVPGSYLISQPEVREMRPMKGGTMVYFQDVYKYVWLDK